MARGRPSNPKGKNRAGDSSNAGDQNDNSSPAPPPSEAQRDASVGQTSQDDANPATHEDLVSKSSDSQQTADRRDATAATAPTDISGSTQSTKSSSADNDARDAPSKTAAATQSRMPREQPGTHNTTSASTRKAAGQTERNKGSLASGIVAGAVAGGVVAFALYYFGLAPSTDATLVAELEELRAQSDANRQVTGAAAGERDQLLAAVADLSLAMDQIDPEAILSQMQTALSAAIDAKIESVDERIEARLASASAERDSAIAEMRATIPDLAPIENQIGQTANTLEQSLDDARTTLEQSILDVEAAIPNLAPIEQSIEDVRAAIPDLAPLSGDVIGLNEMLLGFQASVGAVTTDLGDRLAAAQSALETARADIATLGGANQHAVGAALAVFDLDAAIKSGTSPEHALSMLAEIAGDNAEIKEALANLAIGPVKTEAELTTALAELSVGITAAPGGDTVADQIASNLSTLFSVKEVDDPDDPRAAALKDAQDAWRAGDTNAAVAAAQLLVEAGVDGAGQWIDDANRFAQAQQSIDLLKRLSREFLVGAG